jgi:hypothetical protein
MSLWPELENDLVDAARRARPAGAPRTASRRRSARHSGVGVAGAMAGVARGALLVMPVAILIAVIAVVITAGHKHAVRRPAAAPSTLDLEGLQRVRLPTAAAQIAASEIHSQSKNLQGGPVDTRHGRVIPTPWGAGYVLSDHAHRIACVLINPWHGGWDLSGCVGPQTVSHAGGQWDLSWGVDTRHPNTGVDMVVLPAGGTLIAQRVGRSAHTITLHGGVAVTLFRHPTIFTTDINGRTRTTPVGTEFPR